MQPDPEEIGAVVLRAGSRYLTVGSVPSEASLEILKVEKLPVEWLGDGASELSVGDTFSLPLDGSLEPLSKHEYPEDHARQYLENHLSFHDLRSAAAREGLNPGANPSKEDLIEAFIEVEAPVGEVPRYREEGQPVRYSIMELVRGIQEADGPASEEAIDILEQRVAKLRKKQAVAEAYQSIPQEGSEHDSVQDVADAFGISWRTVHRYVDELVPEDQRLAQSD